jgi:hypothetical protein
MARHDFSVGVKFSVGAEFSVGTNFSVRANFSVGTNFATVAGNFSAGAIFFCRLKNLLKKLHSGGQVV